MELKSVSTAELEKELERRKKRLAEQKPKLLPNPDFSELVSTIEKHTTKAIEEEFEDDDVEHYVFEAAIEAVYGPGYWEWRRAQEW